MTDSNMLNGRNLIDVQQMNRTSVIRMMMSNQHMTRAKLAKQSGLHQATITNIVRDFIDWGLVREVGLIDSGSGRRSIELELVHEAYKCFCIRLTRKHYLITVIDLAGKTYFKEKYQIGGKSPIQVIDEIVGQIEKLKQTYKEDVLLGIGLALPGPFVREHGQIALMTESSGWQNIDIGSELESRVGLSVTLEHDAKAASFSEWRELEEEGKSVKSLLCILLGQGIGAGMIEDGQILRGTLGTAGEVGHMSISYNGPKCACGNNGCLEMYCSTYHIMRSTNDLLEQFPNTCLSEESSFNDVLEAYYKGDGLARRVIDDAGKMLGYGITNLLNIVNPSVVVLADELAQAGDDFLDIVRETVRGHVIPQVYENTVFIRSSQEEPILLGIGRLVIEQALADPICFMR